MKIDTDILEADMVDQYPVFTEYTRKRIARVNEISDCAQNTVMEFRVFTKTIKEKCAHLTSWMRSEVNASRPIHDGYTVRNHIIAIETACNKLEDIFGKITPDGDNGYRHVRWASQADVLKPQAKKTEEKS